MSVKVAVRVRPFNQREKNLNTSLCIKMVDNQTCLIDDEGNVVKTFAFDHSFWSFDGFKDVDGVYVPESNEYAD